MTKTRTVERSRFRIGFNETQSAVHQNSVNKGFWNTGALEAGPNYMPLDMLAMKVALIHSEMSEVLEAMRKQGLTEPSEKVPEITEVAEELADATIRIMDLAEALRIDLAAAILRKHDYNVGRPFRHGKKF